MNTLVEPGNYRILVVEDNPDERASLARLLTSAGYNVSTTDSADKALSYLDEPIDCVLSDLQLGDLSGLDLLKHWKTKSPGTIFLMVTGHASMPSAIEAIKAGAYQYLTKPLDIDALLIMLQNVIRHREASRKVEILQDQLGERSNLLGNSPRMTRIFELIRRSAQAFSTVLILGESGTGKDLVAKAIHQNSPRRDGPFVAVNCAAMPPGLVESELFGHEKGAFTGAIDRRTGHFQAAHGGTLFIDEIGDFDISLQVKLLRVMETRAVTPVGGSKEIKVDTRILAATSRDIPAMIACGKFRKDLYYRLNVITIEMPPLRERLEDIPLLVNRFMERVNKQNGTHTTLVSPSAIEALQQYHWPGNVRELLNVVERMIVLCRRDTIGVEDLPAFIRAFARSPQDATPLPPDSLASHDTARSDPASSLESNGLTELFERCLSKLSLEEVETAAIAAALRRFHYNRTHTARALGISTRTLQRKLGPSRAVPTPAAKSAETRTVAHPNGSSAAVPVFPHPSTPRQPVPLRRQLAASHS